MTDLALPPVRLPAHLFRVDWLEGFGWPECERQEQTHRTYSEAQGAAELLRAIADKPDHHVLLAVHRGDVSWSPLDPAQLPPARAKASS